MISVSISPHLVSFPKIDVIAKGVAVVIETQATLYPNFLGHYSGLDNNPLAKEYQLSKLHIALSAKELNSHTWRKHKGQHRTSDNFVVFIRHWLHTEYVYILDIVHPEAHERIDGLIPKLVQQAETEFFSLNKSQLNNLTQYQVAPSFYDKVF